jgi:hypothetical protein
VHIQADECIDFSHEPFSWKTSPAGSQGHHNWTASPAAKKGHCHLDVAGSDAGGRRAAALYTLIETAKLNDVDPHAWLADVLKRLPAHPAKRLYELLPWAWKTSQVRQAAA